jgi:small subunit ribosomal protein S13
MARIAGVTLPSQKRIIIALTYIYGIGDKRATDILKTVKVDENVRVKDLSPEQENAIRTMVEKDFRVEGELRREVMGNIKRLKDIGSYRGSRHAKKLPVRGQRTKSNSRTVRGNVRKTAGSGRRMLTKT